MTAADVITPTPTTPTIDEYLTEIIKEAMAGEWVDEEDWEEHTPDLRKRLKPLVAFMLQDYYDRGYNQALLRADRVDVEK